LITRGNPAFASVKALKADPFLRCPLSHHLEKSVQTVNAKFDFFRDSEAVHAPCRHARLKLEASGSPVNTIFQLFFTSRSSYPLREGPNYPRVDRQAR
jgi:hypothetical protein